MSRAAEGARLEGQDLAFLAWESRERPMHIAIRADFTVPSGDAIPSLAALRRLIARRLRDEPRLRCRLRRRSWGRRPVWEEVDDIRIERHVRPLALAPASSRQQLDATLRGALDPERPLWEILLATREPDASSFTLIVKLHHALIDGVAGAALIQRLLGGEGPPAAAISAEAPPPRRFLLRSMLQFVREQLRRGPRTPLNGAVAGARRQRVLECDAGAFDRSAKRLHGTHNDLVLGTVAGALGHWLRREMKPPLPASVLAFCPVSLRPRGAGAGYGNHIAPWLVPLPVAEPAACVRVPRIQATTSALRRRGEERGGDSMARVVRLLGPWVAKLGMALAARQRAFQLVVTNVRGPGQPIHLLGARLERLAAFAPLFPGQRASVAVVRYDGRLFWGVTDDWEDPARGARLAADLERELARACAGPHGRGEPAAACDAPSREATA